MKLQWRWFANLFFIFPHGYQPEDADEAAKLTVETCSASAVTPSSQSSTVEKKMAQQIQEFEQQNEVQKQSSVVASTLSSSTTTDGNSGRDGTTTSEWSRDQVLSEVDSTEDSEKGQTSDAESEKQHTATDSGDATLDENKGF